MLHVQRILALLLRLLVVDALTLERRAQLPPIACPKYFEYLRADAGGAYIGRLTLPLDVVAGKTLLRVQWSQRAAVQANNDYRLSLFNSNIKTALSIRHGSHISYRVDFPDAREPPLLLNINVNGLDVCSANDLNTTDPKKRHVFTMSHTLDYEKLLDEQQPLPAFKPAARMRRFKRQEPMTTPTTVLPESNVNLNLTCGREGTNLVIQPFVYKGANTLRGQFPWLAAIYKTVLTDRQYLCGGSLISTQTVISAAHCFRYPNTLEVQQIVVCLGRYNLGNDKETYEKRTLQTLHIHPEYDPEFISDADIALLQLESPISYNEFIQPICLWHESSDVSRIVGQRGVVAGWGSDETGRNITNIPKMVNTSIVSEITCRKSKPHFSLLTSSRTICAGNRDGSGPCTGDSGGGLMIMRDGHWMLRGIVSAGLTRQWRCQLEDYVVYCDLAKHLLWVREIAFPTPQLLTTTNSHPSFADHSRFAGSNTVNQSQLITDLELNIAICGREPKRRNVSTRMSVRSDDYAQVTQGQYPWVAAIFEILQQRRLEFRCGGSLISTRIVITAAHCFTDPTPIGSAQALVQLGRHNLSDYELYTEREVKTLHIHPAYYVEKIPDNDIAILQLSSPVSFDIYIPICLSTKSMEHKRLINGTGVIVGWHSVGQWRVLEQLRTAIISTESCQTLNVASIPLTVSSSFCAYNPNGTSFGIGGYGLMVKDAGRWLLLGIASKAVTQFGQNGFTINCDVANHSQWVYDIASLIQQQVLATTTTTTTTEAPFKCGDQESPRVCYNRRHG